jgi:hypothetical protein
VTASKGYKNVYISRLDRRSSNSASLLSDSISMSKEDMVRGIKRGARWEEIVNRWPFRKGVDHGRAPGLHLHYV